MPEERKIQAMKMDKLRELVQGIDDNTIKSIVAFKSGSVPLLYFIAVSQSVMPRVDKMFEAMNIKTSFVDMTESDFEGQIVNG